MKGYSSLAEAVQKIYPEYPWIPSKFVSQEQDPLDIAEKKLGIEKVPSNVGSESLKNSPIKIGRGLEFCFAHRFAGGRPF